MKRYRLKKALPTFKAGEVFVLWDSIEGPGLFRESDGIMAYHRKTLDKFPNILEEWFEEIRPVGPLIKDEKIRKAVKVWAEANNVLEVFAGRVGDGTYMTLLELYDEDDERRRISVPSAFSPAGMKAGEAYTIAELCGEEEE